MKVSVRRCIACRESADKSSLLRLVLDADGVLCVDEARRTPGRGAYVHRSAQCLLAAGETGRLAHAFRIEKGHIDGEKCRKALSCILRKL